MHNGQHILTAHDTILHSG